MGYYETELEQLSKDLSDIFRRQLKWTDLQAKRYMEGWNEKKGDKIVHHKGFYERYHDEYEAYEKGEYTREQFRAWLNAQIGRKDTHFTDIRDEIIERINHVNNIAADLISGRQPDMYLKYFNDLIGMAKQASAEQGVVGIRFDLIDKRALQAMMSGKYEILNWKEAEIDNGKDLAWNKMQVEKQLLESLARGENAQQLALRFQHVVGMNKSTAIRNAKTALTNARNAGEQASMDHLADMGVTTMKTWVDVHDSMPPEREAHWRAAEEYGLNPIPYDQPFIVGGEELMYPGDPNGSGWNINNCRCHMESAGFKFHSLLTDKERKNTHIKIKVK